MDVLLLRLLLDSSFFLAIFNPLISSENRMLRYGLLGVLAAWLIWIIINWKKKDLEGRVQDVTFSEVKILTVVQVYELVILGFTVWQDKCAPYVAVFVVTVILFLRAGRLVGGSQEKYKFWSNNGVELIVLLGIAVVLSSDVVKATAWKLLGRFYMSCIFPILMLLVKLLQLIFMLLEPLIAVMFSHEVEFQMEAGDTSVQAALGLEEYDALMETPVWAKFLGAAIIVLIFAIVFFFLYQKLAVSGSGRERKVRGEVKKSSLGASDRSMTKRRSLFEEKNVRYYYKKFLNLCKKNDVLPDSPMVTSEMVQTIAVSSWGEKESVEELTALYRDVRYGGKEDQETERKMAKALVKKIKSVIER